MMSTQRAPQALRLTIDRVIVEDLPLAPEHGAQLRAAIEAELGRLLRQGEPLNDLATAALPRLRLPPLRLSGAASPRELAGSLAGRIAHALRDLG